MKKIPLSVVCLCAVCMLCGAEKWADTFYQYRIPVTFKIPAPGIYDLKIDTNAVTAAVNKNEFIKFNKEHFAYPLVRIAVDGKFIDGKYAMYPGKELLKNGNFGKLKANGYPDGWLFNTGAAAKRFTFAKNPDGDGNILSTRGGSRYSLNQTLTASPGTWYRFSSVYKGISRPNVIYAPKDFNAAVHVTSSYRDPMVRSDKFAEDSFYFFSGDMSNWKSNRMTVEILNFDCDVINTSLREAKIAFAAEFKKAGEYKAMLYYSPVEGITQCAPEETDKTFPAKSAVVTLNGDVEKYFAAGSYLTNNKGTFWQADTTEKILINTPAPAKNISFFKTSNTIFANAAKNESEAFQIVFTPDADGTLDKAVCLIDGINPDNIVVRNAEYVKIETPSTYASGRRILSYRSDYKGLLPDPLPIFIPKAVKKGENALIWVDVKVPADAKAGVHKGTLKVTVSGKEVSIPVNFKVYDFTLPEVPSCRTMLAFSQYANLRLFPFHGAQTRKEKHDISRAYVKEMANYRMNVKLPSAGGVYNPELPARPTLEQIYDKELNWAVNDLKLQRYIVNHISGRARNTPATGAKEAAARDKIMKFLDDKKIGGAATVWFDEPMYGEFQYVKNVTSEYKKLPYAKNIRTMALLNNGYGFDSLKGIVDELTVLDNEITSGVSKEGFELFGLGKCWTYLTRSSILWIDAPGMTNRFWAPRNYAENSAGFAIWATNIWWSVPKSPHKFFNPWQNPHSTWGNGATAFFYPPAKDKDKLDKFDATVTPSLRLVLYREGMDDFDYAVLLRNAVEKAKKNGKNTVEAEKLLAEFVRPFVTPQNWTLNSRNWQELRTQIAEMIEKLN